jgi:methylated-DNA-[protein]-cysteine S-methyltransferase
MNQWSGYDDPVPPVITYAPLDGPMGRLWLAASCAGLLAVVHADGADALFREIARRRPSETRLDPDALAEPMRQLQSYLAGVRRRFDLPLDLGDVSPFDAAVYRAAIEIRYGETASYGELAARVGSPRAARAVGGAMSRCLLSPVVPCHRVIYADGSIRGWGPDPGVKRWLHDLERTASPQTSATGRSVG